MSGVRQDFSKKRLNFGGEPICQRESNYLSSVKKLRFFKKGGFLRDLQVEF